MTDTPENELDADEWLMRRALARAGRQRDLLAQGYRGEKLREKMRDFYELQNLPAADTLS